MSATATITRKKEAQKPRLYDFAEGWGSIYGRYVRNDLSRRMILRYGLQTVLEAPCNAESYFSSPGTQSVVFAEAGCAVTLVHHDEEIVKKTRDFWAALGMGDVPVLKPKSMYDLPFKDNSFDLVWNFDSIPLFSDPARFIAEMERVSGYLVMIILPNTLNIGFPIHRVLTKVQGTESAWGDKEWMDSGRVKKVMHDLGMKIVAEGLVDMPPWPGFDVLSALGKTLRHNTVEAGEDTRTDAEVEQMLSKLTFIEYAKVPEVLKTPFSHQRYLIARKRGR
ncbi:MAG: methyltransferase domain-containing protein [Chloroflexota bacterium]